MGVQWKLRSPEQIEAFRSDWKLGMPLAEMAALHGYRNINSVTRTARRLGLPARPGGRDPVRLAGGQWQPRGSIQVWVPDPE